MCENEEAWGNSEVAYYKTSCYYGNHVYPRCDDSIQWTMQLVSLINTYTGNRIALPPNCWTVGSLCSDNSSENIVEKINLHPFKLHSVYLDPLNLSNVGDFSWGWLLKDFIQGQFVVVCYILHKSAHWVSPLCQLVDMSEKCTKKHDACAELLFYC